MRKGKGKNDVIVLISKIKNTFKNILMYSYTMPSQIRGNISLQYLNKLHPFMNKSEVILDIVFIPIRQKICLSQRTNISIFPSS